MKIYCTSVSRVTLENANFKVQDHNDNHDFKTFNCISQYYCILYNFIAISL